MANTGLWHMRRASMLVGTSVQDLESTLPYYKSNDLEDVKTLKMALALCEKRGNKTKTSLLRRKLKNIEKERKAQ
jgi:hypothetical protein